MTVDDRVVVDRARLMAGILVGISGEHDPVPTQVQLDRATDLIMRIASRLPDALASAVEWADCLAGEGAPPGVFAEQREIEAILGDALGYGRGEDDGPCPGAPVIGDHTAVTLARAAAGRLRGLTNSPSATRDQIALAWHDATCPDAGDCRDRRPHSQRLPLVTSGVLERFLERLAGGTAMEASNRNE